jgi:hypothetical protein
MMLAMDQGAKKERWVVQAMDQGAIGGAMDGARDVSGIYRKIDAWCKRWIREL